jgi:hypothetical protein
MLFEQFPQTFFKYSQKDIYFIAVHRQCRTDAESVLATAQKKQTFAESLLDNLVAPITCSFLGFSVLNELNADHQTDTSHITYAFEGLLQLLKPRHKLFPPHSGIGHEFLLQQFDGGESRLA